METDSKEKESQPANTGAGQAELLPCPFCGSDKLHLSTGSAHEFVLCCGCRVTFQIENTSGVQAWKVRWNTRKAPSDPIGPKAEDASYSQTIQELWELRAALTKERERADTLEKALERALDAIKVITSHEPYAFSDISPGIEIRAIESALASTAKAKLKKELGK